MDVAGNISWHQGADQGPDASTRHRRQGYHRRGLLGVAARLTIVRAGHSVFSGCQRQFSTRGPAPKERLWLGQYDTGEVCHPLAACAGALEAWRSWFHSVFAVLPRQSDEAGFLAESRLWNLDGLAVSRVAAPSIHVARTKALIRRNPVDNWAITIGHRVSTAVRTDDVSVEAPAGVPLASRSQLHRLLEAESGVARYVQRWRLLAGYAALCDASNMEPIATVAEELCFTDASGVSRAFRHEFGLSPSDVRAASPAGTAPAAMPKDRIGPEMHSLSDGLRALQLDRQANGRAHVIRCAPSAARTGRIAARSRLASAVPPQSACPAPKARTKAGSCTAAPRPPR